MSFHYKGASMEIYIPNDEAAQLMSAAEFIIRVIANAQGRAESYAARRESWACTQNDNYEESPFPRTLAGIIKVPSEEKSETVAENGLLKFSEKEISEMPKKIRKFFRSQGMTVHYRERTDGRYNKSYEVRYAKKPYNDPPISVSATSLPELKARFIEKLNDYIPNGDVAITIPSLFDGFAAFWFENFHKRKVCEETYKKSVVRYNQYIKPLFGNSKVKDIYSTSIQKLLDELSDRHRLEEDVHSMLNQIFTCAVKHGLIRLNPVGMCFHQNGEREHGIAISKADEKKLLTAYEGSPIQIVLAVMLYTGLRPCEYASAVIEGKFVKAQNRKRKGGKIEYKRIPITPMLRPYVEGLSNLPRINMKTLDRRIKAILPKRKPYDMRTTFETRCDECKIEDRAIGLFMGNNIGKDKKDAKLKKAYTDITDADYLEYLYREGQKLNY